VTCARRAGLSLALVLVGRAGNARTAEPLAPRLLADGLKVPTIARRLAELRDPAPSRMDFRSVGAQLVATWWQQRGRNEETVGHRR